MDEMRRRRDDEVIDRIFEKLDNIKETQTKQGEDIKHINKTLFTNNGELCIITRLNDLNKNINEIKEQRFAVVTTAQAIWWLVGFFATVGVTCTGLLLTVKQLGWLPK